MERYGATSSGWGYDERYKYTGKERDEETGYDYFGARYYAAYTPMWLSPDPLMDKYPGISPYAYCNWNPLKYVDPDGREEWTLDYMNGQFERISDKGGNSTDYYHIGTYEDGQFMSHFTREINRSSGTINVFRINETDESTISAFHIPDATGDYHSGFFLERPGPDTEAYGKNLRIPAQTYKLYPNEGVNYPNVPRLYLEKEGKYGIFGTRGILIHAGNYPNDTKGCLLPGNIIKGTNYVGNSRKSLQNIIQYIHFKNWDVNINIYNTFKK